MTKANDIQPKLVIVEQKQGTHTSASLQSVGADLCVCPAVLRIQPKPNRYRRFWWFVLLIACAVGCLAQMGCASKHVAFHPGYHRSAPPTHSTQHIAPSHRSHGKVQTQRPGLGTEYGQSVSSHVHMTSFTRASAHPVAQLMLYYNDPEGVSAMARYARGSACCAPVSANYGAGVSMYLIELSSGQILRGLRLSGRTFVMGRHGSHYAIQLRNHTNRRYEIVLSVDGLDVIDGRRASTSKRGYILSPYKTLTVQGFRQSMYQVAAFRFSSVRRSYAARTGSGGNIGVIGAAIFTERRPEWSPSELHRRWNAQPFGNSGPPADLAR